MFLLHVPYSNKYQNARSRKTSNNGYKDFRNGLLHAAAIYGDSTIVNRTEGNMIDRADKGSALNRAKFHPALVSVFDTYIDILSGKCAIEPDIGQELQGRTKLKIQNICQLPFVYFDYGPDQHSGGTRLGKLRNWKVTDKGEKKHTAMREKDTMPEKDTIMKGTIMKGTLCEVPSEDRYHDNNKKDGYLQPILVEDSDGHPIWVQMYMETKAAQRCTNDWAEKLGQMVKDVLSH